MGNWGNDYYLLLGNQELEGVGGSQDLQRAELQWSFQQSSSGNFGGALVEYPVELWWTFMQEG
jgi:hypothetical protein